MKLNLNIPLQSLSTKELDILQYVHDHSDNISSISIQQFANELNYSHSTNPNQFCLEIILCRIRGAFDYLIYPYYPAYMG